MTSLIAFDMTKKEQLKFLADEFKQSKDANLKKLVTVAAQSSKLTEEQQKKVWTKVEEVVGRLKKAKDEAETKAKQSAKQTAAKKPAQKKPAQKKPSAKTTGKRGPKSAGETFFGRARMIRDANPKLTWKEAQQEAKKFFADERTKKANAIKSALSNFPDFEKATKDTISIPKDSNQPAKPPGKRRSRKGAKRKFYWESRSNRSDLRQPPKDFPLLARGGKIDRDNYYPSPVAGRPEWKQIYDLTDKDPDGVYATLSAAQLELLKRLFNAQTSNGITTFMDVGQGILVRAKSGTPSKELNDVAIASIAEVPSLGGYQMQGKNELFIDYMPAEEFKEIIVEMMDSNLEYDGSEFLEAKLGYKAGYPFKKGGRPKSAHNRDHKYQSNEPHEKAYAPRRKRKSRYVRKSFARGGNITKDKFDRYVKVQRQGDYNMLTQADLARGMANLTKEEYYDIINNYAKYQKQFYPQQMAKGGSVVEGTDEDGFPPYLEISPRLRKKVREDAAFAKRLRRVIETTNEMQDEDISEAVDMFRSVGVDLDYDLGGEPIGMDLIAKGGSVVEGTDEDGFPPYLEISGRLRKKVREDAAFAERLRRVIETTNQMQDEDISEAVDMFRSVGVELDYDLGGEPIGMDLIAKGGRFARGGKAKVGVKGYRMMKRGGEVIVKDIFEGRDFSESAYPAFFGDFDNDGVLNADDAAPLNPDISQTIEDGKGSSFVKSFKKLNQLRAEFDKDMYDFLNKLKKEVPDGGEIVARTKSPSSIIKKLIEKRLLDKKGRGLTDVIGTTIVVKDRDAVEDVRDAFESGRMGKVEDFDDFYATPQNGYRAYHFIVKHEGKPVEVQVKTQRQKTINELSHAPYKAGKVNVPLLQNHSKLADLADRGDKQAQKEFRAIFNANTPKDIYFTK